MATLGKIRNHGVLLLIVIGVALLIFIVTDFVNNSSTFFRDRKANVGTIAGEKVKYNDFFASVQQMENFYKVERGQVSDAQMSEQIREEAWNQLVMTSVVAKDASKIGMSVSKQELTDLTIGKTPSPIVAMRPMFQNPETGVFDPNQVVNLIKFLDDPQSTQQADPEQVSMLKSYWKFLENQVTTSALTAKYNTLLSKALVVNSKEATYAMNNSKESVDLVYAMKPYFMVSDSTVSVDKKELQALYDKRKEQFKQEEAVDIEFVKFLIAPSAEDIAAVKAQVDAVVEGFVATTDSTIMDTVNYNSDIPFVDEYLAKNDVPEDLRVFAFESSDGIYGPVMKNDIFTLAKVVSSKVVSDSVKISIIALQEETEDKTKAKVDSIMALSKAGIPFATLATQYSLDKNTAAKGGDIGWIREIGMSKDMVAKAFDRVSSEPFVISQGNQATIFVVTERTAPVRKVKLAIIERQVAPSSTTQSKIFQEAKQFASAIKNTAEFEAKAQELNYIAYPSTNTTRNQSRIMGMENTRQVIRWAFDGKENATSDVFECDNNLIVATVSKKYKEGYRALSDVEGELSAEIRNDKKFEQMKQSLVGKSIEQLQSENLTLDTIRGVSFASQTAGSLGNEPALIAKAPNAEVEKVSEPIKGKTGAYVFKVLSKSQSEEPMSLEDTKKMLMQTRTQVMYYFAVEALKEKYEVKDQRYNFY